MTDSSTILIFQAVDLIIKEFREAKDNYPPFNSAHEGYAVILDELEELWKEVRKKRADRSPDVMCREAVQVGAMALRFIVDLCATSEVPDEPGTLRAVPLPKPGSDSHKE